MPTMSGFEGIRMDPGLRWGRQLDGAVSKIYLRHSQTQRRCIMGRHFGPGFEFGKFGPGMFGMRFGPRGFGGPHGGGFGGDWAEEFGFGGGGRRGRRGRMFESGELRLVLLKL